MRSRLVVNHDEIYPNFALFDMYKVGTYITESAINIY